VREEILDAELELTANARLMRGYAELATGAQLPVTV
jgi:hypothetical protein